MASSSNFGAFRARRCAAWPRAAGSRAAWSRVAGLLTVLVATACISKEAEYAEVRSLLAERTGVKGVEPHSAAAERRVSELLKQPLTAESAAQIALAQSESAAQAFTTLGIGRARALQLWRLPNPKVELGARFGAPDEPATLDLAATLDLTELLLLASRGAAADHELHAARLQAAGELVDLYYNVQRAFYAQHARQQAARLQGQLLATSDAALEVARAQHLAGNITELELAQREAAFEEQRLTLRDVQNEVAAGHEQLRALLGVWRPEQKFKLADAMSGLPEQEPAWGDVQARALAQSLDVGWAREQRDAAERRGSAAVMRSIIPELGAGASAEREEGQWSVGPLVELEVPLFYQGAGERALAEAEQQQYESRRRQAAIEVRSQVRAAWLKLRASRARALQYSQQLLPVRRRILQQTLLTYNAMVVGVFQLLEAQRALASTELAEVNAVRDYWLARADIEQLLAGRRVQTALGGASVASSAIATEPAH
jgi:outer membrane protein, heavy metal efflux system